MRPLFPILLAASIVFSGCSPAQTPASTAPATPPPTVTTPPPAPTANGPKLVRVLAQTGHFPDWLKAFCTTKAGVPVEVKFVTSPEEEQAALTAPDAHYDIALVADRIIPQLIKGNELRPIPTPHEYGIDFHYVGHGFVDKDNKYSLPYGLSLMAVGIRVTAKGQVLHWADLDNPSIAKQTYFTDSVPIKVLDAKGRLWATTKKNILPDQDPLAGPLPVVDPTAANYMVAPYGAMRLALGAQATDWKFVLPEDGSIIYLYHMVLPASGQRPDLAYTLFPLLFDPTITSHLDSDNFLSTTQAAALALSPADQAHDLMLYPPLPVLSHCVFSHR